MSGFAAGTGFGFVALFVSFGFGAHLICAGDSVLFGRTSIGHDCDVKDLEEDSMEWLRCKAKVGMRKFLIIFLP